MENESEVVNAFPEDLQYEILLHLPLRTLAKFRCVSTKWASMISEIQMRPRVLFAFYPKPFETRPEVLLHSVYQEKEPLLSCGQQKMHFSPGLVSGPTTGPHVLTRFPRTVDPTPEVLFHRGLVCVKSSNKIVLCNPGTKKILALPQLEDYARLQPIHFNRTFIGYDKTNNVVKVLCGADILVVFFTYRTMDYRVYTVGSGDKSWRTVVYKHVHTIATNGLCRKGVLYYGAYWCSDKKSKVLTFNINYEVFATTIELPEGFKLRFDATLVNYNEEIGIVNDAVNENNGEFHVLLVMNNNGGGWRNENIVIPRWRETADIWNFITKVPLEQENLFSQENGHIKDQASDTQILRKFQIETGVDKDQLYLVDIFLNNVDNHLLT